MDEALEKLKKLVLKELDRIASKGDINPSELEAATKAVCLLEKIKMVDEYEPDDSYSGYSNYGMNPRRRGRSYNGNNSYKDYYIAERDYGYPMDRGYSGHSVRDRMISQLESTMMDSAQNDSERRVIESLIGQLNANNYQQ